MKAERVSDIEEDFWSNIGRHLEENTDIFEGMTGSEIENIRQQVYNGVQDTLGINKEVLEEG